MQKAAQCCKGQGELKGLLLTENFLPESFSSKYHLIMAESLS
jgi:hypothetical protein